MELYGLRDFDALAAQSQSQRAEIERLTESMGRLEVELCQDIADKADEIDRLRAALRPFAQSYDLLREKPPDHRALMFSSDGGGTFLGFADVGDLRRASGIVGTFEQSTSGN